MESVKEMDNFLNTFHLPELNQAQIKNLNRPIICREIKSVIKSFPDKKSQGQIILVEDSIKHLKNR